MADPFSIVASSFAVVGAADVILRASAECYRFLSSIRDAPDEINELRSAIQEDKRLVQSLQTHLSELRDPTSCIFTPAQNSTSELDGFGSAFRALQREMTALEKLAKKHGGSNTTWGRVKWHLDERKIAKSLEKLDRAKFMLSVALSLLERRRAASTQNSANIKTDQSLQKITRQIDGQLQEIRSVKQTQDRLLSRQDTTILQLTRQFEKTRVEQGKATQKSGEEHALTRREIANSNGSIITKIHTISSKLDDVHKGISQTPARASISNREIFFFGQHRETILAPLLLIKDHVRWAILHLLSHHAERASARHLYWLQFEYDSLVRSATQEAAAFCEESTATPFDRWNYLPQGKSLLRPGILLSTKTSESEYSAGAPRESSGSFQRVLLRPSLEIFSASLPIGQLYLMVPGSTGDGEPAGNIDEASIMFIPREDISHNSIRARFVKSKRYSLEPKLCIQLSSFRVVEELSLHRDIICDGTVEQLDQAFRTGVISPYDRVAVDDGYYYDANLCVFFAARFARLDLLRYLDSQGVGPSSLNSDFDPLGGFWHSATNASGETTTSDEIAQMLEYIGSTMRLCTLESYSPLPSICLLLHSDGLSRDRDYPSEYALITKKWMQFLLQYDYSLEHRDKYGRTPLLDYSYRTGGRQAIETIRLLLEFGANTQAVDIFGQNAIHCAMFADNEHSDILEEKFNLLIKGGVDIHQREYGGWTPSRLARALGCWETWCKALERNGLEIRDILQQHGELWLLDEWSEDDDTQDDNSNKGRQDEVESDEEASE